MERSRLIDLTICGALVAIIAITFGPLYHADFVNMDDWQYVKFNYRVWPGLSWHSLSWIFQPGYASNWHPLTWLSHMLDCQIFGVSAGPHHLVNVAFHAANSVLLFVIFKKMTRLVVPSAVVALLFAIHPLHMQSVAWISERKDVLSAFFGLLTIGSYLTYTRAKAEGDRGRAIRQYGLTVLLFALGLMSKPMLVTWPFVLLLLDYWPLERFRSQRFLSLVLEKVPLFVLCAFTSYMTTLAQKNAIVTFVPLTQRLSNALWSYLIYLKKTLWPTDLSAYYPYPTGWLWWEIPLAVAILAAISAAAIVWRRSHPYFLCGWLWFLGTLVPAIGIVQVGAAGMADRYTYLPLIGVFFAVVWGVRDLLQHLGQTSATQARSAPVVALLGSAAVAIASFIPCDRNEVYHWHDSIRLFERALLVTDTNFFAISAVGDAYSEAHYFDLATRSFKKAINLVPNDSSTLNSYAKCLAAQKKYQEALSYLQQSIIQKPEAAETYCAMANNYSMLGQWPQAEECFRQAIRYDPQLINGYMNLATLLALQNKFLEAVPLYEKALGLAPAYPDAHFLLASTVAHLGEWPKCVAHLREAINLNKDEPDPINDLAWILATTRLPALQNRTEAIVLAKRACALSAQTNAGYLDTLAVAYAKNGQLSEAIRWTKTAREIAATNNPALARLMDRRLTEYNDGQVGEFRPVPPAISTNKFLGTFNSLHN